MSKETPTGAVGGGGGSGEQSPHRLEAQRRANRDAIIAMGLRPYGARLDGLSELAVARRLYDGAADAAHHLAQEAAKTTGGAGGAGGQPAAGYVDRRPIVRVAGRVVLHRDNGRLVWLTLRDDTGELQVAVSKKDCDEKGFALAKLVDLGDVVVAAGPLMKTRTGEITVWAKVLEPASKCLMPPPEKHAGLHDVEQRYRRRYVDLWATPETMRVMKTRSRVVSRVRRFLDERDYLEVETPLLQQLAGGAAARPFVTHMNALGMDLFLRIAPELYLKRLLVGGMPRVYEVSRNFRNEGLDKTHNPEFTSLEVYQAFGNYLTVLELAESLIRELATMVVMEREDEPGGLAPGGAGAAAEESEMAGERGPNSGELKIAFGDWLIDYGAPFERITYAELFRKGLGFPMTDTTRARQEAQRRGLKVTAEGGRALADVLVVNELFEEAAEKSIDPARPTFVMDYPAALSPLTRPKEGDPSIAERWDLFIGGMEIGPAYTELNDPDVQEAKFREQLAGIDDEESTFRTFDQDFIDALKVGMPPAGGVGLRIDRLVILLTGQPTIRDLLLFPMMPPV